MASKLVGVLFGAFIPLLYICRASVKMKEVMSLQNAQGIPLAFFYSLQNIQTLQTMQLSFDSSCAVDLAAYFQKDISAFELDLSHCTLVEVLDEYTKFKQRLSPRFNEGALLYNIRAMETEMHTTIFPHQITDIFYTLFAKWLRTRGLCYSSIKTYCDSLSAALRWGTRYKCNVHPSFDSYNIPKYRRTKVALTPDEVSHIAHFDINTIKARKDHRETLERVRDMFVLSCNLGQRHSDCVRICADNFERDRFSIVQQKTGNKAKVNISEYGITPKLAMSLLEKYNYEAPYQADISNYNKMLHELLQHIGGDFLEMVTDEQKVDGLIKITSTPKWKLISSHTARRTFVTYNVTLGKPEYKIRQASGHLDHKSFEKYIILDED